MAGMVEASRLGSCLRVAVDESDVEVHVSVEVTGGSIADCADVIRIELGHPLGDRQFVDAATGEIVPVQPGYVDPW